MVDETNDGVDSSSSDEMPEAPATQADPIKNLKGEFDRKLGNVQEMLAQQQAAFNEVLKGIQASRQAQKAPEPEFDDGIEDLMLSNPKKAAQIIKERTKAEVKNEIRSEISQRDERAQERMAVASQMTIEYPELAKSDSELTVETLKVLNSLDPSIRESGHGVRLAIREAAAKLGVVPASRRQSASSSDDFTLSGRGNEMSQDKKPTNRRNSGGGKLSENAKAFAELVGLNTKDPKVMERLEKRATRQNFKRYKGNE